MPPKGKGAGAVQVPVPGNRLKMIQLPKPIEMSTFSLYIHIPYCHQKCPYCDFNTYATPKAPEEDYIAALCKELTTCAEQPEWKGKTIQTLFFGGGTPSIFSVQGIAQILSYAKSEFNMSPDAEITLEANPNSITNDYALGIKQAGINRLSLGAQTFKSHLLKVLGRDHSSVEITEAVHAALKAGIKNISIDLIYGTPNQTLQDVLDDVKNCVSLPITHVSAYSLTYEQGTPFFQSLKRGTINALADETVIEMMDAIESDLHKGGFTRYEISNYSKTSFSSKHNSAYWNGSEYLGIGAGAHSFCYTHPSPNPKGRRWSNLALPKEYMEAVDREGKAVSWKEELNTDALTFEYFFLGLRKLEGISEDEFTARFGLHKFHRYVPILETLITDRLLTSEKGTYALSRKGIHLCDSVLAEIAQSIQA